ncbi:MAG TPA: methylated-DNA--[protein]-cysteine S-methyltransferase [Ferruginibacter sp.]|nr:methylated-DNA--[protein]-cysteine S-methyltransferase [Ferruginibacter sp.]HMP21884.1 methylated-DNA--[protein]-cysteine S-methyltransferase [Ferruginibacter sp.]
MTDMLYHITPLGLVEIRTDGNAITSVSFVQTGQQEQVPTANTQPLLQQCTQQLDEYFAGTRKTFDLPVAQSGTAFQQQVWAQLQQIPFGKTISYLELAKRINNVKAIRAVGTTNGSNSIAILVPCHRVIGSDGSLTGYAGGLWRKQWLLEHENKYANGVQALF